MSLNSDQFAFTVDVAKLILWVYGQPGWTLTCGEMWRPPQMAELYVESGIGIKNSLHIRRLAFDALLFIDGKYKTDSESYKAIGEYWKSLSPLNRWGGDFKKQDGNHFEKQPSN